MRVIAVVGAKGGVGKTAAAVNLAKFAADSGFRTLLWDLDPQGAATHCYRLVARGQGWSLPGCSAASGTSMPTSAAPTTTGSICCRRTRRSVWSTRSSRPVAGRTVCCASCSAPSTATYDVVILDCAPGSAW